MELAVSTTINRAITGRLRGAVSSRSYIDPKGHGTLSGPERVNNFETVAFGL